MKTIKIFSATVLLIAAFFLNITAAQEENGGSAVEPNPTATPGAIMIQTGALEKIEGRKYILRKVQAHIEFYAADSTKFFLKSDSSAADLNDKVFVEVRGPKNKKAILANAVYIYESRNQYNDIMDRDFAVPKNSFQAPLLGTIKQMQQYIILTAQDGADYLVCVDEDTIWVNNKTITKADMIAGDRLKLFFDKRLSIRYNNYPVKVVVDRSKAIF
jgi:hypothetical protein